MKFCFNTKLFILLGTFVVLIPIALHLTRKRNWHTNAMIWIRQLNLTGYETCKFPKLDPWDSRIMRFYKKQQRLKCVPVQPRLVYVANGKLIWDAATISREQYDISSLMCQYQCVSKTSKDVTADLGKFHDAPNNTRLTCELVHVKCSKGMFGLSVYDKFISFILPKLEKVENSVRGKPNIIIFVVESQSRSNFIRQLPKTYDYLMNLSNAFEFTAFNKAGSNSYPNAMALLEDAKIGYATADQRGPHDDRPLIFFNYSKMGYVTQYSADWPKTDIFNNEWRGNGFVGDHPFDHYQRPLWIALWNTLVHWRSSKYCYDDIPRHKMALDNVNVLFEAYPVDVPIFSFSWIIEIAHDFLNDVGKIDDDLLSFVQRLHPYFNNSFFMIMGDHGQRIDIVRESQIGRLEERLPFFAFVAPQWFTSEYPDRTALLRQNANGRLTTFYDVYATLAEILHETYKTGTEYPVEKGISLFRGIPINRTCADAFIDDSDCACLVSRQIDNSHPYVKAGSNKVLSHLNSLTKFTRSTPVSRDDMPFCTEFTDIQLRDSFIQLPSQEINLKEISLTIDASVQPGDALFEARVTVDVMTLVVYVDRIDRINRYGNQSHCVDEPLLKPICICSDLTSKT